MTRKIAVLVGSLRKESFSRKIAKNIEALAPAGLTFEEIDISKVGHYNQDLDGNPPAEWVELRDKIKSADAVLFVTPEYNRSVPGVLKNAIDHASRPYAQSAWAGKPAAVITLSPGAIGGFGANHHLRQSLVFLDMPTMAQPEAYVGNGAKLFGADGSVTVPETREFLSKFMAAFAAWIGRTALSSKQTA